MESTTSSEKPLMSRSAPGEPARTHLISGIRLNLLARLAPPSALVPWAGPSMRGKRVMLPDPWHCAISATTMASELRLSFASNYEDRSHEQECFRQRHGINRQSP